MTDFDSLSQHEQTLAMLLAYFDDYSKSKSTILGLGSKLMVKELASDAFKGLLSKNIIQVRPSYYGKQTNLYKLESGILLEALYSLFELRNGVLLKSIRTLYKREHNIDKPDYGVRRLITLIASTKQPENLNTPLIIDEDICHYLNPLLDKPKYREIIDKIPDYRFASLLNSRLLIAICNDEDINWEYLKELVSNHNQVNSYAGVDVFATEIFAFYYYFATGELCIDLNTAAVNQFTLQLIAIQALYKGDYQQAYKIFLKAFTLNNKVASESGIFVNPVSNYYYLLALLLIGTEESLKKVNTLSKKNLASYNSLPSVNSSYFIVQPMRDYFCDKIDITSDEWTRIMSLSELAAIATLWLSCSTYKRLYSRPEEISTPAQKPKWAYLKLETQTADGGAETSELKKLFGGEPLLSRLNIKEAWRRRLESLIKSNISTSVGNETKGEAMLIYLIRNHYITPIVKRKLKSGKWSVGKEISVNKLKTLDESLLDDTDNRLIKSIKSWDYYADVDSYLPQLVGCNHVYVGSNYDLQPVTIHEDKPFLIIDKQKDGTFKVSTNIEELLISNDMKHYVKKNTDTDYSVIFPKPQEVKVYREILAQDTYPAEAEPLLVKLITALGGKTEIHSNMVAELDTIQSVDAPPVITLRILPINPVQFNVTAMVCSDSLNFVPGHGNITTIIERDGKKLQLVRKLKAEKKNMKRITEGLIEAEVCDEGDEWLPDSVTDALTLTTEQLLLFMQWCKNNQEICTMEWPENQKLNLYSGISSSSASISFMQKGGWFEVEGNVEIDKGQVISLQKLLNIMRENNKQKFIRIGDNEYITLSTQLSRILKRLDTVTSESHSHLQMAPAAVSLIGEILDDKSLNLKSNPAVTRLRKRIEESNTTSPFVPNTLNAQLRDYQEEGFEWLSKVTSWGAGVCLADDMGLGKTLQTIALLLEQSSKGPSLVVAPASVVPNWRNELRRFAPTLNVIVLNQSDNRTADIEKVQAGDVVVITYMLLNIEQKILTEHEWVVVCLDEAHTIKNANTKMSKAAMQLKAQRKVILTGTPIQNHLSELWNLFQFINPGLLGSAEQFKQKFIQPIEGYNDKERQSQLRRLIAPFLLRRTKGEVIKELPDKTDIQLPVELSSNEITMYEMHRKMVEEMVRSDKSLNVSTLAEITKLRQMACSCSLVDKSWKVPSSKLLAFIDLAESLNDSGNRALVFSQFTSFLEEVRYAMDNAQLPYLYLDGSTPMAKREQLVKDFQAGKCPFFLISLKAGGLGLNLTGANYVVHLDPWWNPAIEQQATDRAYRIGQQQDVTVYHLISQHTIEEKILRLHKTKRDLADSLLEGSDMAHAITQEEMLDLLKDD